MMLSVDDTCAISELMVTGSTPVCYVIAGPNGSGKTTFAMKNLPARCSRFINVDEIAKGIAPFGITNKDQIRAGRLFHVELDRAIADRKDFAFETTLSGRGHFATVERLRSEGWRIVMFYLFIPTADYSRKRVAQRVASGGHDVPQSDIERRFPRSVANMFEFMDKCDSCLCFDNRGEVPSLVFVGGIEIETTVFNESVMNAIKEIAKNEQKRN